jgi:uncharacterized iron-regulated protein
MNAMRALGDSGPAGPRRTPVRTALAAALAALAGCAAPSATVTRPPARNPAAEIAAAPAPDTMPAFDGRSGRRWSWPALVARIGAADAVFIGEQHDDAGAHKFQSAVADAMCAARPGAAISLEMLERDDQYAVDGFLAGTMTTDEFIDAAGVRNWAGSGTWMPWYQPVIEVARARRSPVVAANAPRRFVSQARTAGYESLDSLPPEERALFDIPESLPRDAYRQRLADLMRDARDGTDDPPPTEEEVDAFQRAQLVWDATMAASAARAIDPSPAVVHLAGAFHIGRDGATVTEFVRRRPGARTLTIVCVDAASAALRPEDVGLADIVVYTRGADGAGADAPGADAPGADAPRAALTP